jgi:non-specific serine/threonine protein kinase
MALRRLGILDRLRGDMAQATARLEASLELSQASGDASATYLTLYALADTVRAQADYGRAIKLYEASLGLMRGAGDQWHAGQALLGLGYAAALMGDHTRARAALGESLRILHSLGDRRIIAACLEGFACLASLADQPDRAAHLFGCADGLRASIGAAAEPFTRADNERATDLARAGLGEAAFAATFARGHQQPLEAAIAWALAADPAAPARPVPPDPRRGLTPREHEVARLLARGLTNRAIAAELVISEQTAETHVKHILAKVGLASRTEVAARAAELGLAPPEPARGPLPT